MGSGPNKPKIFWKGFTIPDTIKISDLWEEVKIPTLTGVWKKLIPSPRDDFEGVKSSVEVTVNMI